MTSRRTEDIPEHIPKDVGETRSTTESPRPSTHTGVDTCVAELIVGCPLLSIGENLIGLFSLLEVLLGFGPQATGIAIRVVFHCETPVGLLDLRLTGILVDTQDFVIVTF
jgi:hypothetical protein